MKYDIQKLLSEIQTDESLTLSEEEKGLLESRLREYMAFKPLPVTPASRVYTYTHSRLVRFAALTLIVALGSTSTASYAAEGALPGDTLYPVKVHVNENVRRALAQTPVARAAVETELAARRLDEAHELAKQKRLTPALRAELEDDFDEHADRVEAETKLLEREDEAAAHTATTHFESKLRERTAKFEELEDEDEFRERIERRTKNIRESRERVEEKKRDDRDDDGDEDEPVRNR